MKRLYIIVIATTLLAITQAPRLIEASCTAGSLCTSNTYYKKGLREIGKVWYLTVFAGTTNPPDVESRVFGIEKCVDHPDTEQCSVASPPTYFLSGTVHGFLTCIQSVCIRNPDKPQCSQPGNTNGTPYQVQEGDFFLDSETTACEVKGPKGTCKVLKYDHILDAAVGDNPCPGGFVPDFSPDPFIGRTCTCDVSQGDLTQDQNGKPICQLGDAATCLCKLVAGLPNAIGEPYTTQQEIVNDGGTISIAAYDDLACTPNTSR